LDAAISSARRIRARIAPISARSGFVKGIQAILGFGQHLPQPALVGRPKRNRTESSSPGRWMNGPWDCCHQPLPEVREDAKSDEWPAIDPLAHHFHAVGCFFIRHVHSHDLVSFPVLQSLWGISWA